MQDLITLLYSYECWRQKPYEHNDEEKEKINFSIEDVNEVVKNPGETKLIKPKMKSKAPVIGNDRNLMKVKMLVQKRRENKQLITRHLKKIRRCWIWEYYHKIVNIIVTVQNYYNCVFNSHPLVPVLCLSFIRKSTQY